MKLHPIMLWPQGKATVLKPTVVEMAAGVVCPNRMNILETPELQANASLVLIPHAQQRIGDRVLVRCKTAGTQTLTFAGGIDGPVLQGVAGKKKNQEFVYVGDSVFEAAGAPVQVD